MTALELAAELGVPLEHVLPHIGISDVDAQRIRRVVRAGQAEAQQRQDELAARLNAEADARHRQYERQRIDVSHPGVFKVVRPAARLDHEVC